MIVLVNSFKLSLLFNWYKRPPFYKELKIEDV